MSNITFDQSLEKCKAVYFHFLDGFINSEVGDTINNIQNFISENRLVNNNINILVINNNSESYKEYKFTNISNKIHSSNSKTETININFNNLCEIDYIALRDLFSYCIYQTGNDGHATSFLVFEKNNKLFLLIINSGAGINLNDSFINDDKILYSPYNGIVICENTEDKIELKNGIIKILNIFQLPYLYNLLKDPVPKYGIGLIETKQVINTNKHILIVNFNKITYVVLNLKKYFSLEKINSFDSIKFKYIIREMSRSSDSNVNSYADRYANFNIEDLLKYNKTKVELSDESENFKIDISFNYYQLILNIFAEIKFKKFTLKNLSIDSIDKYNLDYNMYREENKIEDLIIKKLVLHTNKDNFFIHDQESGSCSWFSIYWPIVLYNIFINNDENKYAEQIKKINTVCYEVVQTVFSTYNFKTKYNSGNYDSPSINFEQMKKLCNKFIDIKLLSRNILDNEVDFIFKNKFKCNICPLNIMHSITESYSGAYYYDSPLQENCFKDGKPTLFFIYNFVKNLVERQHGQTEHQESILLILCYDLYLSSFNNKNIFSNTKVEIKNNIINEIICFIQTLDTSSVNNINDYQTSKKRMINELKEVDEKYIKTYLNYAEQFNETYDYDINSNIEKSYFREYIPIAIFLNQANIDKNPETEIVFGYDGINKRYLINFIIFLHRFNLLIKILDIFYKIIAPVLGFQVREKLELDTLVGDKIFDSIVKKYFNCEETKSLGQHFYGLANRRNDLFKLTLCYEYLTNYIPEVDKYDKKNIKEIETFDTLIDNHIKIKEFFYKYPKYLCQTFDGRIKINNQSFIHLNIYDIFKPENEIYRNNLIYYYTNLWYDHKNYKRSSILDIDLLNIVGNLQLLILKYEGGHYVNGFPNPKLNFFSDLRYKVSVFKKRII